MMVDTEVIEMDEAKKRKAEFDEWEKIGRYAAPTPICLRYSRRFKISNGPGISMPSSSWASTKQDSGGCRAR
jgi:hypothetical protein